MAKVGWFDADIWQACLEDHDPPLDPTPLTQQATYIRRSLQSVVQAWQEDPDLADCLRRHGLWRTQARLGLTRAVTKAGPASDASDRG